MKWRGRVYRSGGVTSTPILYYLHTFLAVATHQSFTRAANELGLSQPGVSAHIRGLERAYQASLFEIRRRRPHLTAEGEALVDYARRVFNILDESRRTIAAIQGVERGHLRLAASPTIGVHLLPPLLRRFADAHPSVQVELIVERSEAVVDLVVTNRVPLGLIEAPVTHTSVEIRPFAEDDLVLIAPPSHPLAGRRRVRPDDLRRTHILRREAGSGMRLLVDTMLSRAGLSVPTAMELGSTEALKHAALAGIGLAWVPRLGVERELRTGELVSISVPGLNLGRTLSLVTQSGAQLPPAHAAFVGMLARPNESARVAARPRTRRLA
jgi:DNA-binding transcriptional LysR family regulator